MDSGRSTQTGWFRSEVMIELERRAEMLRALEASWRELTFHWLSYSLNTLSE